MPTLQLTSKQRAYVIYSDVDRVVNLQPAFGALSKPKYLLACSMLSGFFVAILKSNWNPDFLPLQNSYFHIDMSITSE